MRNQIGDSGTLAKDLPTLCCDHVIPAGQYVLIKSRVSKQAGNPRVVEVWVRILPEDYEQIHNVKISKIWFT